MGILPSCGLPEKLDEHRRLSKTIHHIRLLQIYSDGQMTSRWSTALTPIRKYMSSPQNMSKSMLRLGHDCGYSMLSASSEVRFLLNNTGLGHSHMSWHWEQGRRTQRLKLNFPYPGSCRELWGHSSASSSPNQTNTESSAGYFTPILRHPPLHREH